MAKTAAVLGIVSLIAGCSILPSVNLGFIEINPKDDEIDSGTIVGFVYADEPAAGRAGSAMLQEGGTAADAATAIFFTMAVSYPTGAGLGAGGSCVYWDARRGAAYGFDFPNQPTGRNGAGYPVPGAVKGFSELHSYYGRLPWARVLVRAELFSRDGFYASRATAVSIRGLSPTVRGNGALARLVRDEDGAEVDEQSLLRNRALAQTITQLRVKGAKGFYEGEIANRISDASRAMGNGPTRQELANYQVRVGPASAIALRGGLAHLGGTGVPGSRMLFNMLSDATVMTHIRGLSINGRTQVLQMVEGREREALGLNPKGQARRDAGSAAFTVIDIAGNVAACGVSLGAPVGSQRMVGDLGFVFGSPTASPEGMDGYLGVAPMIVSSGGDFRASVVGSGGFGAAAGVAAMTSNKLIDGDERLSAMIRFSAPPNGGRVSALACDGRACEVEASPRGFGLAERVREE